MTGSAIVLKDIESTGGSNEVRANVSEAEEDAEAKRGEERDMLAELEISVKKTAQQDSVSKMPARPRSAPMRYKVPVETTSTVGGGAAKI